jgi:L-alanine-DL-glutamate epimerase-like enolase superfamily enzyme
MMTSAPGIGLAHATFQLPLRHVFTIARGSVAVQDTFIVQVTEGGVHGYGEATTNPFYGQTIARLAAAAERVRPLLAAASTARLPETLDRLGAELADEPFTRCALDMALHDLAARRAGQGLAAWWGLDRSVGPESNFTIGIDTIPVMREKLAAAAEWPIYKIKLGTDDDLAIVRELRRHTDRPFRVDANCGWTAERAIALSAPLAELGVEFIEQPLPPGDPGMEEVRRKSALPVFADESCAAEDDVARCAGQFHGINIKLVKCGGLAPARRMIATARSLGLRVMVGCMTESTVGISALAQLLPLLDHVDMDGAALLAADIATGVRVVAGRALFPAGAGTGVELLAGPLPAGSRAVPQGTE